MSLTGLLAARREARKPVRAALIGAGKFGSMFLSQVPTIPGLEVAVIADLDPERARNTCRDVGWDAARVQRTRFTERGVDACTHATVEVVIEATGNPLAGIDPEAADYVERIKGIAEALVIVTDEKNRVWAEWSKIVIEGLIDLEIRYHEEEVQGEES